MKYFKIFILSVCSLLIFGCSDDDNSDKKPEYMGKDHAVIAFFPYTVNLYGYLSKNISDIEEAMLTRKNNPDVIVYINDKMKESCIYRIRKEGTVCVHDTLVRYDDCDNTKAEHLSKVFSQIKNLTPDAKKYDMIIGCHGMGWLYGDDYNKAKAAYPAMCLDNNNVKDPITRWIGVNSAPIDIDVLSNAMETASLHTNMMLFDVCYMGNVETLYELRNNTDYIVASSIEIMSKGMPYTILWNDIAESSPESIKEICRKFYTYYNSSSQPYVAISAVDCSKLDNLSYVMRDMNARFTFKEENRDSLQILDGFSVGVFYDMGRYIELTCDDDILLDRYNAAMNDAVMTKYNTNEYYTALTQGKYGSNDITYFSGMTISDPSLHPAAKNGLYKTSWHKATN